MTLTCDIQLASFVFYLDLRRYTEVMRVMVRRMDDINAPSTAGPDEPHEALAQAENSWQDVELAAERARGAYGDLYTSIQSRRFKPGPGFH